jgi:hypothetical protein
LNDLSVPPMIGEVRTAAIIIPGTLKSMPKVGVV